MWTCVLKNIERPLYVRVRVCVCVLGYLIFVSEQNWRCVLKRYPSHPTIHMNCSTCQLITRPAEWVCLLCMCVWLGAHWCVGVPWLPCSLWRYKVNYQCSMGWKTTQESASSSKLSRWLHDDSNMKYWLRTFVSLHLFLCSPPSPLLDVIIKNTEQNKKRSRARSLSNSLVGFCQAMDRHRFVATTMDSLAIILSLPLFSLFK